MATINVADLNRQGKVFTAANVSAKTVSVVGTAMTGLVVYNPVSSGKKLVLLDVGFTWTTAPVAVHQLGIGVMNSSSTAPSSLTASGSPAQSADGTGFVGAGIAWDTATLPVAPTARRWFGGSIYASAAGNSPYMMADRVDGSIIIAPGAAMCIIALTTAASGAGHMTWAEYPV